MNVVETATEGGGYEQRYSIAICKTEMAFVRRPVSICPDEGTVCFADNGPRFGTIPQQGVALYEGGKWKLLKFEPSHWVALDQ